MLAACFNETVRSEDVLFSVVNIHEIERSIAVVLCMSLDEEDSSGQVCPSTLNDHQEKLQHHSVLVLPGAVVEDENDLFERIIVPAQSFPLQLMVEHRSNVVSSLSTFTFEISVGSKLRRFS